MDRFDDSRNKKKRISYEDPRDTRALDITPEETKKPKPAAKSLQELIDEEMKMESAYKHEKAETTENGKVSESMTLLSMAQREEIFTKKCAILNKYSKALSDDFDRYRRSLSNLATEKDSYGKAMYSKGILQGRIEGEQSKEDELLPLIEGSKGKAHRLKLWLMLLGFLEILTAGILLKIII